VLGLGLAALAAVATVWFIRPHQEPGLPPQPLAPSPSAAPIRALHAEPATLPSGAVAAGSGSTRIGNAGTPLGFAHSPDGAVAAGTAWLMVLEGSGVLDPTRRYAVLDAIGEPAFVSQAGHRIAGRLTALGLTGTGAPHAGYVTALALPERGAYRLVTDGADIATLDIWYPYQLAVVADGAQPGPAHWLRTRMTLRWDKTRRDWRLTADPSFMSGPDPHEQRPSFVSRAQALSSYGSGWHTYAGARE